MLEALLENIRVLSLAAYAKARAGFSGVIRTLQGFNLVTRQVDEDAPLEAHRLVRDECLDRRLGARLPLPCPARSLRCAGLPACTATP